MMNTKMWIRWLETIGGVFVALGLYMAIGGGTAAFGPFKALIDPTFWGDEGPSAITHDFQTWSYAVLGAVMVALGVMIFSLSRFGLGNNLRWAWWTLVVGVIAWYIPDTAASIIANVWFNAIGNTAILVAIAIPLAATRRLR
jgi:hypothetical protein